MVGGGKVGMEVPVVALAAKMTRWAVGGRRSHPFVYFFVLPLSILCHLLLLLHFSVSASSGFSSCSDFNSSLSVILSSISPFPSHAIVFPFFLFLFCLYFFLCIPLVVPLLLIIS